MQYRVWDKDTRRMYYGAFSINAFGNVIDAGWRSPSGGGVNCIVMRRLDHHSAMGGSEVYEGDILRQAVQDNEARGVFSKHHPSPHIVLWDAFLEGPLFPCDIENWQVVGNVYQHPDSFLLPNEASDSENQVEGRMHAD